MRIDLADKVVIITGASEGIGAALAAEFARAGARLSLTARSEAGLKQAAGPDALLTPGDLTDGSVRSRIVDRTLERFGAIDILINNAGAGLYIPSWSVPMEQVRSLMELNFFAALGMIQLVVPHMRQRRTGTLVNVGSIGGKVTLPWMTVYSASKYAIGSLTEGLRMELRCDGIHAMLAAPGYVKTGFQRHSIGQPPEAVLRSRRFAIEPARCALDIRRGVERQARTVVTPPSSWLLAFAAHLFPGLTQARMAKINGTA
jgi:short-subunit dehydrogenase